MSRDGQRLLGFALAVGTVLLTLMVLGDRLLGLAAGPEAEIITWLKKAEPGAELSLPPYGTVVGSRLQFERLSVSVNEQHHTAIATGTLDFMGVFNQQTKISSLGLERIRFRHQGGKWVAEAGVAPRLTAIVQALEVRRRRLEAGDLGDRGDLAEIKRLAQMSHRDYRSEAWFIRSERDAVEVAEDYRLVGDAPQRPIDERATKRITLAEDSLGRFFFPNGLL